MGAFQPLTLTLARNSLSVFHPFHSYQPGVEKIINERKNNRATKGNESKIGRKPVASLLNPNFTKYDRPNHFFAHSQPCFFLKNINFFQKSFLFSSQKMATVKTHYLKNKYIINASGKKERKNDGGEKNGSGRNGGRNGSKEGTKSKSKEGSRRKMFSRHGKLWTSGSIEVEKEEVLQAEEFIDSPLWVTFSNSAAGVWKGVGACFSPITGELEPIGLGSKGEYLFDARTTCKMIVESKVEEREGVDTEQSLRRILTWRVGNQKGEELNKSLEGLGSLGVGAAMDFTRKDLERMYNRSGEEGKAEDLGKGKQLSANGEEDEGDDLYEEGEESDEEIDGEYLSGELEEYGEDEEDDDDWDEEDDEDEEEMEEGETEEMILVGSKASLTDGTSVYVKVGDINNQGGILVLEEETGVAEEEEDLVEDDAMGREPGLVFFEDGSYSRGPLDLLSDNGKVSSSSEQNYVVSPTFRFEQCVVRGGHTRLRLQHTITVDPEGEDMEVLRVAVFEEEWMGPNDMKAISDSGGHELPPFSEQARPQPESLSGPWKVFEITATVLRDEKSKKSLPSSGLGDNNKESPSIVHSCRETLRVNGLPIPASPYMDKSGASIEDVSILWLPNGITAKLEVDDNGFLTLGVGWLGDDGTRLSMERVYNSKGQLKEVRSGSEVKGGWVGGSM